MDNKLSVTYMGRKALLAGKLGRELSNEEAGSLSSYRDIVDKYMKEVKMLADISSVFATAYVQYMLPERFFKSASLYVCEVLKGGGNLDKWMERNDLN